MGAERDGVVLAANTPETVDLLDVCMFLAGRVAYALTCTDGGDDCGDVAQSYSERRVSLRCGLGLSR